MQAVTWLDIIKRAIAKKYNVTSPAFYPEEVGLDPQKTSLQAWMGPFDSQKWLICYRSLGSGNFNLKPFPYPLQPNELVGKQLIDSFFEQLYATVTVARHKIQFTIFGDCVYSQDEITRDLWYLLHEGRTVFQVVRHELEADGMTTYYIKAKLPTPEVFEQQQVFAIEYQE